jgi:hypothetical protein
MDEWLYTAARPWENNADQKLPQKIKLTIRSQSAKLSLQVKVMNGTGQPVVSFEAAPL